MTEKKLFDDLNDLEQIRDELRVQLSLAKADAKKAYEDADKRFGELKMKLGNLKSGSKESMESITTAANQLAKEVRNSFANVKKLL